MEEKTTKVTKQETLAALRNPGELYVVMSAATKLPFVICDEETFDDKILLYYTLEDAKVKARELSEKNQKIAVVKLETKHLLPFYTNLFTMGVNCLSVNEGTDTAIQLQLTDLVKRKDPGELPQGVKIVENPSLHLTGMYFMQELHRLAGAEPSQEAKELQEELLAHYQKGEYIVAVQEDGQVPILKQKDGTVYQPVFTDFIEFQKFARGKKFKTAIFSAAKLVEALVPEAKGVVINPFGINIQLQVNRPKKQQNPGDSQKQ